MDQGLKNSIIKKNDKAFRKISSIGKKYAYRIPKLLEKINSQILIIADYLQYPTGIILSIDNYCALSVYYNSIHKIGLFTNFLFRQRMPNGDEGELKIYVLHESISNYLQVIYDADATAINLLTSDIKKYF